MLARATRSDKMQYARLTVGSRSAMIRAGQYAEMAAFAAVAEERSFRRAAVRLNLRPSTLSHAVRALEERLGVRLLARTTRSVALTAAGAALAAEVGPALRALESASASVDEHRARPHGTVRLTVPQSAATSVLAPKLGSFARAYPDVVLDVSVDDGFVDLVRDGYDAGIRLGESVGEGMTAVRVGPDARGAVVASPGYWADQPPPVTPRDLARHRCIGRRFAAGRGLYRWRFARDGERLEVACDGPLVLDSEQLMRWAALDGVGVAMLAEEDVTDDLAAGTLVRVLDDWCPPMFAFFLYHPSRLMPSASLRALIDVLTMG